MNLIIAQHNFDWIAYVVFRADLDHLQSQAMPCHPLLCYSSPSTLSEIYSNPPPPPPQPPLHPPGSQKP